MITSGTDTASAKSGPPNDHSVGKFRNIRTQFCQLFSHAANAVCLFLTRVRCVKKPRFAVGKTGGDRQNRQRIGNVAHIRRKGFQPAAFNRQSVALHFNAAARLFQQKHNGFIALRVGHIESG